jgi:hypothetical protein
VQGSTPTFHEWRRYLEQAVTQASGVAEAICPFGFEATGDPRYAQGRFSRYFVYVRYADKQEKGDEVLQRLVRNLFRTDKKMNSAFRIVAINDDAVVRKVSGKATLYLKTVPTSAPLLEAYSTYLALTSPLIISGNLLEVVRFLYCFICPALRLSAHSNRRCTLPRAVLADRNRDTYAGRHHSRHCRSGPLLAELDFLTQLSNAR